MRREDPGMERPAGEIDGAEVLWWAEVSACGAAGATVHRRDGEVQGPARGLAICRYAGESGCYLFYCDEGWVVANDTFHDAVEGAKGQAAFEYEGVSALWRAGDD